MPYLPGSRILQSISQKIFQLLQLVYIWFVSIALGRPAGLKKLLLFIKNVKPEWFEILNSGCVPGGNLAQHQLQIWRSFILVLYQKHPSKLHLSQILILYIFALVFYILYKQDILFCIVWKTYHFGWCRQPATGTVCKNIISKTMIKKQGNCRLHAMRCKSYIKIFTSFLFRSSFIFLPSPENCW